MCRLKLPEWFSAILTGCKDKAIITVKMRSLEIEQATQLVQHIDVLSGKWKSPYHTHQWQLAANIPGKFQPAVSMAEMILNPRYDWTAEAFRIEDDSSYKTSLHLAMKSNGGAPLHVPLFGRPTLKLKEVISPFLWQLIEKFPIKLRYREFLLIELPVIFAAKLEENNMNNLPPDLRPGYDRVIIKPFWFFEGEGEQERAVAEDPFRLVFNISGAPLAYIRQELKRQGASDADIQTILFENPQPSSSI